MLTSLIVAKSGVEMLFMWAPFLSLASQNAAEAKPVTVSRRTLPMLPSAHSPWAQTQRDSFPVTSLPSQTSGNFFEQAADFLVHSVKRVLHGVTSSLTALGSRANALFATVSASLAYERATRDFAHSLNWNPSFAPKHSSVPSPSAYAPWWMPWTFGQNTPQPIMPFGASLWNTNPWAVASDAIASLFQFNMPYQPSYGAISSRTPSQTFTVSSPWFTWDMKF